MNTYTEKSPIRIHISDIRTVGDENPEPIAMVLATAIINDGMPGFLVSLKSLGFINGYERFEPSDSRQNNLVIAVKIASLVCPEIDSVLAWVGRDFSSQYIY